MTGSEVILVCSALKLVSAFSYKSPHFMENYCRIKIGQSYQFCVYSFVKSVKNCIELFCY